ncbi:phosphate regulon transcriptional regulator PhoB [Testudinibacter sp. TR-2022]|uniref:phosphate regulon transcriptional regulator PhoB n=1 Tax=Testudinibacter sp. TR-2022 TaxID=2585029 RepID=UPI001118DD1F|nr:phosphate regulon transcriptional regulator PhoB [Testudinibacter sp. TR-2022]TNH08092.1 phosphate regulon transcriptional regulatory protein PhoB [Pasteurellaceae bacterium Phil11]TNH24182.1 phosphate regulon transcriptional regulatory protein PhoB [Testudinibacter sp. TR-2022]TNH24582.1 phosphate regulon transcriptional regulatory protein PhoB [Testudinibacter sp. TR-2022]
MSTRILLVEDEVAIREMVALVLLQQGYEVMEAGDYRSAIRQVGQQIPHLVVLDWMLPGKSGLQFLQYLKQHDSCSKVPVVMLTAKSEEADCIACLNAGADDYVTKPFSPKELVARLKAVLRRSGFEQGETVLEIDGLMLDNNSHRVTCKGKEIALSSTEFKLLHFFMKHPEKVYTREKLLDRVWGDDIYVEDRTVDVYIRRLRKNLQKHGYDHYIQTVRGAGYRFSQKVK